MKLYGHPMSTCTRKVLTVLAEKGQEVEFVVVDITKGEQKHDVHLARQPFGRVPAIEDDGLWLYESRAMMRYLDEKLSGTRLQPTDLRDRAMMEQWLSVEYSYFSPAAMKIVYELLLNKMMGKPADMEKVKSGAETAGHALDVAEKALVKQEYFGNKTFSLADIAWMPYVQYLFAAEHGHLVTSRPGVKAWWERVSTRPSWKKVVG
jgi:glutathione S-transferase